MIYLEKVQIQQLLSNSGAKTSQKGTHYCVAEYLVANQAGDKFKVKVWNNQVDNLLQYVGTKTELCLLVKSVAFEYNNNTYTELTLVSFTTGAPVTPAPADGSAPTGATPPADVAPTVVKPVKVNPFKDLPGMNPINPNNNGTGA